MPMAIADIVILAVLVFFVIAGMIRGFVKSLLSLVGTIGAMIISYFLIDKAIAFVQKFYDIQKLFLDLFTKWLANFSFLDAQVYADAALKFCMFLVLFILIKIAVKIVEIIIVKIIKTVRLSFLDRFLGMGFGVLEAYVFVCFVLTALMFFPNPDLAINKEIEKSQIVKIVKPINIISELITPYIPKDLLPDSENEEQEQEQELEQEEQTPSVT